MDLVIEGNTMMPGPNETDRMMYLVENSVEQGEHEDYEEVYEAWTRDIPQGPLGPSEEFGNAVDNTHKYLLGIARSFDRE